MYEFEESNFIKLDLFEFLLNILSIKISTIKNKPHLVRKQRTQLKKNR